MPLAAVAPIAFASDTISIAIMEVVDNAIMLLIPGAMEAALDDIGFWAALAVALLIAGAAAYPANRWLLARGKGHAVVHQHHDTKGAWVTTTDTRTGTPTRAGWRSRSR